MESQPQNPEFRNNPKNFHLCRIYNWKSLFTANRSPIYTVPPQMRILNSYAQNMHFKDSFASRGLLHYQLISKYWTHWSSFKE